MYKGIWWVYDQQIPSGVVTKSRIDPILWLFFQAEWWQTMNSGVLGCHRAWLVGQAVKPLDTGCCGSPHFATQPWVSVDLNHPRTSNQFWRHSFFLDRQWNDFFNAPWAEVLDKAGQLRRNWGTFAVIWVRIGPQIPWCYDHFPMTINYHVAIWAPLWTEP